jgi:drug/metabolite transporter (DMT)-like permease
LFTVLVMAAAGDEKLHPRRVAGVVAGLIGAIILRGQDLHGQDLHGQDLHGQDLHGQDPGIQAGEGVGILLCLAAAFSYGFAALYARRKLSNSPPLATATFQLLTSSLMMTIVAAVFERPWQLPRPGATTWLAMMGLAGLSTALAYIVFFQVLRRSGSTNVMLVTLLVPVTAIVLGYLVLGESIAPREIVGALVIGSALLLIDGRVLSFVRRVPAIR